jgi:hypothetical protein
MEFRCDRCGTRYSTTQAIGGSRAYQYRCRVCQHSISVRVPAGDPAAARAPGVPGRDLRSSARLPSTGPAKRLQKPPPLPRAALSAASAPPAPARRSGYIEISDDDVLTPTGIHIDPFSARVDPAAAMTPAPVRRAPAPQLRRSPTPSAPIPRVRSSFRSADAANRAPRETTSSFPRSSASRQLGGVLAAGRPGLLARLSHGQRFLASAAVFTLVTGLAVTLGIGMAARATERRLASPAAAPTEVVAPVLRGPMAPEPGPTPIGDPPDPYRVAPLPSALRGSPELSSARAAAVPEPPARGAAAQVTAAPRGAPGRAGWEASGAAREPSRASGGRGLRVASVAPARPSQRRRDAALSVPTASGRARRVERVASAASLPSAGGVEEPVAARPGYRVPVPVTPGCVEQGIRLPASWSRQPPRSVIMRFAVDRRGSADLIQLQPGPDRRAGEGVEPDVAQALRAAVRACRFSVGADERGQAVRMWTVMKVKFAG